MIDRIMTSITSTRDWTLSFPNLVHSRGSAIGFFLLGGVLTIVPYQLTNRFHLFEPRLLPFDWVDNIMPFWPWTVWIYFTEYLIFIVSWVMLQKHENRTKYFYAYIFVLATSVLTFIFYPVTFPRADFPLTGFDPGITTFAFHYFRTHLDSPANCLPSLHVSSCYLAAFSMLPESRRRFWFFFIWATAVAISTMTTKQHYFVDVWTAVILVTTSYLIFYKLVSYR